MNKEPVVTAPQLESLEWLYSAGSDTLSVHLDQMSCLRSLGTLGILVYGLHLHDCVYNYNP